MTDNKQPEALRLADLLDANASSGNVTMMDDERAIAQTLRRLYAENAALQQALVAARLKIDHLRSVTKVVAPSGEYPPSAAYAELPIPSGVSDDGYNLFLLTQMRDFADRTHALRASHGQAPAPTPQADSQPALPKITSEDRSFLHYNPNTDDVVEWVQNYARCCIDADRAARAAQPLPAGEYLPLPRKAGLDDHSILPEPGFSADQMHAYVDADRAMRVQAAQGEVFDEDGFRAWVIRNLPDNTIIGNSTWRADYLATWVQRFMLATPQPSPTAQADSQPAPVLGTIAHVGTGKTTLTGAISSALRASRAPTSSVLEDTARLDWLLGEGRRMAIDSCDGEYRVVDDTWSLVVTDWMPTPRAAIDAARKQGGS